MSEKTWLELCDEWDDTVIPLRKKLGIKVKPRYNEGRCGFCNSYTFDGCRATSKIPTPDVCVRCQFFRTPEEVRRFQREFERMRIKNNG